MSPEDEQSSRNIENDIPRTPKPPPIYIYDVTNYAEMVNSISSIIGTNDFICKALINSKVKINVQSIDNFRKFSKNLKEKNVIYHTYQIKKDRAFRVVIRHLHHSADIEDIKHDLANKGFEVRNIINITNRITNDPLPLFLLT